MQKKVLEDLYRQGGLTSFVFPGDADIPLEPLQNIALAMNAGARFMLVDFSGKNAFKGNAPIAAQNLFESLLDHDILEKLQNEPNGWIVTGSRCFPQNDDQFRTLYHNLQQIKASVPQVVAILPLDINDQEAYYAKLISRLIVIDGESVEEASAFLEDLPHFNKADLLWLLPQKPNRKKYYHAYRAIRRSHSFFKEIRNCDWRKNPADFAKILEQQHKISILEKNPLDGSSKVFRTFFPLLLIIAIIIPFLFVTEIEPVLSNTRNRSHERDRLSVAPSFEYTFDGKESMQRIARYAIGRFNAVITNESMIRKYVGITLEENGFPKNSWDNKNKQNIPPAGTIIKFSRPDYIGNVASDSIGAAWKYWTTVVSDSVAYLTEFYHAKATANFRQHNGIDVASRQGARILAPFAAKAWTARDERGGIVIGLVRQKDVIIFMHCDQLLYLDGQEVMAGDPIATVGLTGHTTGPHAHIVTGLIDKNGDKRIGNVRYKVINPIQWFYMFKPTADAVRTR
ncbi:M23 family metallopeptidase [uncultured Fibrobacter sp.]|uniref:M23 family metallopeptidase n=1 Tax=uncultured Fibrobacter sp. TaxID=261512 RepID=UPI0026186C00|nr:M23 family metallopeptidase [uncultured Fibrobacter sp.]